MEDKVAVLLEQLDQAVTRLNQQTAAPLRQRTATDSDMATFNRELNALGDFVGQLKVELGKV